MTFSFGFIYMLIFLGIVFVVFGIIHSNAKNTNETSMVYTNILLNLGLIIFSGILYMVYKKVFDKIYSGKLPSIFIGIIVMIGILFSNFSGIMFSILHSKKIHTSVILYGLFIVSTILTFNGINIIINLLIKNKIISECSTIIYVGIFIVLENIVSYILYKLPLKKLSDTIKLWKKQSLL